MTDHAAATGGDLQAPGLRRRLACLLYEGLLLFGVGLISGVIGTVALKLTGTTQTALRETLLQGIGVVVYGVYFIWFWSRRGQTLPMQTWHIKLVTAAGERLTPAHAALRYLACSVWVAPAVILATVNHWPPVTTLVAVGFGILGYAMLALLHPQHQYWHDVLCGTRLVTALPPPRATT